MYENNNSKCLKWHEDTLPWLMLPVNPQNRISPFLHIMRGSPGVQTGPLHGDLRASGMLPGVTRPLGSPGCKGSKAASAPGLAPSSYMQGAQFLLWTKGEQADLTRSPLHNEAAGVSAASGSSPQPPYAKTSQNLMNYLTSVVSLEHERYTVGVRLNAFPDGLVSGGIKMVHQTNCIRM